MTRLAIVRKDKCNPKRCSRECSGVCPINRSGGDCIIVGEKAFIDESLCTGCGLCPKACPFQSIKIINLPQQLKETPTHRYGDNQFELFRLPYPQKDNVVGILGANGVGKSTALKILAGLIKPNLGKYNQEISSKELINFFKGTELQNYFKNLLENKTIVSFKPQYVDAVLDKFKGTAKDLLKQFGKEKEIASLAAELNINQVLDRNLKHLSGGELQKVMIAAAMLKKANLYFFDEPASYLDIKERIKVAKSIRSIKESVLVVEHDLIILDYLTDIVHILYGTEAAYGVVSHPQSSKNGINSYLDGFLKDENMRFRPEPIKFIISAKEQEIESITSMQWPSLKKKLGTFNLEIEPSELRYKEVLGIVGSNGIGKTTFMKMLAGIEKPDEGELNKKLKIAYKPQHVGILAKSAISDHTKNASSDAKGVHYIKSEAGATVRSLLASISKKFTSMQFKNDVITPLRLEPLMNLELSELSGGELQSVAIAACLLQDADLYLFDEPSTYLDVEQRLQAAKAIQKAMKDRDASAIVIDHDLMFISYISDRLMVFDGVPAKSGKARKIQNVKTGMNDFLKSLDITMRKDAETGRPRVNKAGSQKDQEQKKKNKYYV